MISRLRRAVAAARSPEFWTKLPAWAWENIVGGQKELASHFRAAVIGSLVGAFVGIFTAQCASRPSKTYVVTTSSKGYGFVASLFEEANREGQISLRFDPPDLQKIRVCDFAKLQGHTAADMAMAYIESRPGCFNVTRESETSFVVWPKSQSPDLDETKPDDEHPVFWCKCPDGVKR